MWIEKTIQCPYCWEEIDILIDPAENRQDYIEDCQVCCRPIHFKVFIDDNGEPSVQALHENET